MLCPRRKPRRKGAHAPMKARDCRFRTGPYSVSTTVLAVVMAVAGAVPSLAISPAAVLDRVESTWRDIHDYSCDVFLNTERLDGGSDSHWGRARLVRPMSLRIDLYPSLALSQSATAEADLALFTLEGTFFQYSRPENILYVGSDPEQMLLPFVLALAGREGFDRAAFNKHYYIKAEDGVPEVELDGQMCYLLQIEPKGEDKELKPRRSVWIERSTLYPVRVEISDNFGTRFIRMMEGKPNLGLDPGSLEPLIPGDADVVDLTEVQDRYREGDSLSEWSE